MAATNPRNGANAWQAPEAEDSSRMIGINGLSPHGDAPIRKESKGAASPIGERSPPVLSPGGLHPGASTRHKMSAPSLPTPPGPLSPPSAWTPQPVQNYLMNGSSAAAKSSAHQHYRVPANPNAWDAAPLTGSGGRARPAPLSLANISSQYPPALISPVSDDSSVGSPANAASLGSATPQQNAMAYSYAQMLQQQQQQQQHLHQQQQHHTKNRSYSLPHIWDTNLARVAVHQQRVHHISAAAAAAAAAANAEGGELPPSHLAQLGLVPSPLTGYGAFLQNMQQATTGSTAHAPQLHNGHSQFYAHFQQPSQQQPQVSPHGVPPHVPRLPTDSIFESDPTAGLPDPFEDLPTPKESMMSPFLSPQSASPISPRSPSTTSPRGYEDVFGLEMDSQVDDAASKSLGAMHLHDPNDEQQQHYGGAPNSAAGGVHSGGMYPHGEHPSGEFPSPTLFVRNINSNVEDEELRALFEPFGPVRSMYTQCKHRGFVMISYYDIRHAQAAMRSLQGRAVRRRRLDIHYSIPKTYSAPSQLTSQQQQQLAQQGSVIGTVGIIQQQPPVGTGAAIGQQTPPGGYINSLTKQVSRARTLTPPQPQPVWMPPQVANSNTPIATGAAAVPASSATNPTTSSSSALVLTSSASSLGSGSAGSASGSPTASMRRAAGASGSSPRDQASESGSGSSGSSTASVLLPDTKNPPTVSIGVRSDSALLPSPGALVTGVPSAPVNSTSASVLPNVSSAAAVTAADPKSGRHRHRPVAADDKGKYELNLDRVRAGEDRRLTLMIKNIPNKYSQKMLLAAVDEHFKGTYDFFYLPIDFKNKCNVGYAFVNFIHYRTIPMFYMEFNNRKWEKFNSEKVCIISYARIQGKHALISHFQNSSLMSEDKKCRPLIFHSDGPNQGEPEPFPVGPNVRSRRPSVSSTSTPVIPAPAPSPSSASKSIARSIAPSPSPVPAVNSGGTSAATLNSSGGLRKAGTKDEKQMMFTSI